VLLVDRLDPAGLKPFSRVLLPLSVTRSANYSWLYATACLSPTIAGSVTKVEGRLLDASGKERKTSAGARQTLEGSGLVLWTGSWELFDLPPGTYTLEVKASDKDGRVVCERTVPVLHGEGTAGK
jgi:hypothetical protein